MEPTRRCDWHCRRSSGPSSSRSCPLRPPSSRSPSQRTVPRPLLAPRPAGLPYLSAAPSACAIRPCRHPAMAANARAMAARPTARLPMLLHRTHVLGRMCVHCVPLSASPKTPEVPNAVQCASCEFQYACFPTTSAVSRSRLIEWIAQPSAPPLGTSRCTSSPTRWPTPSSRCRTSATRCSARSTHSTASSC